MSNFFKRVLFWAILTALMLGVVIFINGKIDNKKSEKSENKPNQKIPQPPNNDKPKDNPEPFPPTNTENWWLTDEEIECAYQEIRKELASQPEIQLVSPSVVRTIQEGANINEDLKKAEHIFFPINNSENHETADTGSHWTLLLYFKKRGSFYLYDPLKDFNKRYYRKQINEKKLAEKFREKLGVTSWTTIEDPDNPKQNNDYDCGVYIITFTRALVKKIREKGEAIDDNLGDIELREKDLIFSIAEERQKLKEAGFPKKGSPGKDYDIGDDVDYYESEENRILEWYISPDVPLRKFVKKIWVKYNLDTGQGLVNPSDFKDFSQKVRKLSGISKIEKEKLAQIYRIKKILKACSLPLEEYKKTKSFNGKDNFREDKITSEESQFVRENINKEVVKEINDLYSIHFPGK
jgi:hypothetical protein